MENQQAQGNRSSKPVLTEAGYSQAEYNPDQKDMVCYGRRESSGSSLDSRIIAKLFGTGVNHA